mmetsp:Transcript_24935/g.26759  ORF Transcript_24935/g.26759 Transcript_24935/m.26759 type:complete len:160 (+) Transcript_24935:127-606(+)
MTYHDDDDTTDTVPFGNSLEVIEPSTSSSREGSSLKQVFVIATTMIVGTTVATTYSGTGGNTTVNLAPGHGDIGTKYLNPKCAGTEMLELFKAGAYWTHRTESEWKFVRYCVYSGNCISHYTAKEFCDTCAGGPGINGYLNGYKTDYGEWYCAPYVIPK